MYRNMFAGGNTPGGFYSSFEHIMPLGQAKRRIFLKGSSGSGKSFFMKKLAKVVGSKISGIELFHCSNDVESLDAIAFQNLGYCVMDGTAPHINDPVLPGAVDKLLNFGDCLNEKVMRKHEKELKSLINAKKPHLISAYGYFSAAGELFRLNRSIYAAALDHAELYEIIKSEISRLPEGKGDGKNRRIFARAITPDGIKSYSAEIVKGYEICGLSGEPGSGAEEFLERLRIAANESGFDTEGFYNPMDPAVLEHLLIPKLNLVYTTTEAGHRSIDFNEIIKPYRLRFHEDTLKFNEEMIGQLLEKTILSLFESRKPHERIEELYAEGMDFGMLDAFFESEIDEIENLYVR